MATSWVSFKLSPAITVLAMFLLLLLPAAFALGSLAGGDGVHKDPSTLYGGSIVGREQQQGQGHGGLPLVRSARRSLGGSTPRYNHPNNPGDGGRNPPVSPARDKPGPAA
ncbi:hypothetical protein E2562_019819 [Oryza meyeriana var. granulata]|uniref:Uncharacterized protein n=1 Tax=Oryza meyeriana var. granulata TaxID=110450 RepID=A0A6G1DKV5_9ORYZ|nr:hypothetical protein E2562_019819 [Oryza meyeriana var. granulata]